jgi:hypothetical protein
MVKAGPAPATVNVIDAAPAVVDLPAADSEHERVLPADGEHFAALTELDVAGAVTGKVNSRLEAWSPSGPSGPIWSDR